MITSQPVIDPAIVPKRRLFTGATMPAIGLGTFGSDHLNGAQIAAAVEGAIQVGYRHIDCAAVYGNEASIGTVLHNAIRDGVRRDDLWIASKLWNDKHAESDVIPAFRQSLADLQLEYLDLLPSPLAVPQFPSARMLGGVAQSRRAAVCPREFLRTWRQLEKLVDLGLVRHIGTSNMTIPKLRLLLRDARIRPAVTKWSCIRIFSSRSCSISCVHRASSRWAIVRSARRPVPSAIGRPTIRWISKTP